MNEFRKRVTEWLDDRIGLSKLIDFASHKTVPVHRFTVFYYLGGMTLFFFLVQVFTGILLMLYYRPSAEEAYESVEFMVTMVPFGWLIRSLHAWSANLMVFFAFIHMASTFFLKAYRPPRELTWVSGALLFLLILAFGFSGYLLPWNQLSFFATKVGTDIAGAVPLVGEWTLRFLRGGDRVTGATLARFYGWHVAVLPAIAWGVLLVHLLLVQIKGMSVPPGEEVRQPPMKFFPHFALRDLFGWLVALGVLAALAALFPWELGEKADLFAPAYPDIKPEWYYIFMFQTLKLVPGGEIFGVEYEAIPILLFGLGGLVLILVPFLDRRQSRAWSFAGVVALIYAVGMTCWGYESLVPLYIVIGTLLLLGVIALVIRAPHVAGMLLAGAFLAVPAEGARPQPAPPRTTSCIQCHDSDLFSVESRAKIRTFRDDVHAQVGLSCHDCHGGNPALDLDMASAMDESFAANPYRGVPSRKDIPDFCGRCHSSADTMKRFNPAARVDQVAEYRTSVHGRRLAEGDTKVATCIDCHGVHGIRRRTNPDAPVYPTRVADTCGRCHSDAKLMAGYPIPTDQHARWKVSVHARALLEKGDLTAPTCNDCHGNHGATPPGVESVSYVCGTCHAREAELFRASAKHAGWSEHNEMLASSGTCAGCHDDGRAKLEIRQLTECVTCHENHSVVRPGIALIGMLPDTPCAFCHEGKGPLERLVAEPSEKATNYRELRAGLLATAAQLKLTGAERFDWLVEQAQQLPTHRFPSKPGEAQRLRPEFARLFDKFRISRTHYSYRDDSGREVSVPVRSCTDCHVADETGRATAARFLDSTRALTSMIARAERILLAAHRGGVEVKRAREELDAAVDNQIELEALAHTFGTGNAIEKKSEEGLQHARAALVAAQASLDELAYRRRGLFIALGVIVLSLVALAMKIRML